MIVNCNNHMEESVSGFKDRIRQLKEAIRKFSLQDICTKREKFNKFSNFREPNEFKDELFR